MDKELSDRELLKLAAKAAGIKGIVVGSAAPSVLYESDGVAIYWDPLTNDGDALRLAVKLGLLVDADVDSAYCCTGSFEVSEEYATSTNPYAAIRRAIVRAAAEIGKGVA